MVSTAHKRRVITQPFTVIENEYYITLYFLGNFVGNFDNWQEVQEAKREIQGY